MHITKTAIGYAFGLVYPPTLWNSALPHSTPIQGPVIAEIEKYIIPDALSYSRTLTQ
jgi:hypothetical protein